MRSQLINKATNTYKTGAKAAGFCLVLVVWSAAAFAAPLVPVDPSLLTNPGDRLYQSKSDQELTALTASWGTLSGEQRRALLTEVKHRMAVRQKQSGVRRQRQALIRIETRQRYGNKVRIQTQYVQVRPTRPGVHAAGKKVNHQKGFGTGFENRGAGTSEPSNTREASDKPVLPVITVKQK